MSASEVRTYASVVFEAALKDWLDGLGQVVAGFNREPNLLKEVADTTKTFERRQNLLLAALPKDAPQAVHNFLLGMLSNGDITLLDEVVDELSRLAAAAGDQRPTIAEVTSAMELSNEERLAIQNKLIDQFGAGLEFRFNVNPAILGGLIVRVGDKLLDTSVASRLSALRQSLGVAAN